MCIEAMKVFMSSSSTNVLENQMEFCALYNVEFMHVFMLSQVCTHHRGEKNVHHQLQYVNYIFGFEHNMC